MSKKIARVGDRCHGTCHHPSHDSPITVGGTIITGSDKGYDEDRKIARVGDKIANVYDATIITGSNKTYSD